jgi:hypothetical protein
MTRFHSEAASLARDHHGVRSGAGFLIRCPVPSHGKGRGDRNPSCSISDGEKGFVAYCHGGCDSRDVLRCLGVEPREPASSISQPAPARKSDGRPLWLWKQRQPITPDTPPWRYLRQARGYDGPLPATLGYLPARNGHPPSLIAAFAVCTEPEPGVLAIADADVRSVHITRLAADGSGKAGTEKDKIVIGTGSMGSPIVLAPPNDLLGLAITEGLEDALSIHAATGLGAWAAGAAGRMPALAEDVPAWIDHVTVVAHSDQAGVKGADSLHQRLAARGISSSISYLRASA